MLNANPDFDLYSFISHQSRGLVAAPLDSIEINTLLDELP
jgi:hypothetical protein